MEYMIEDNKEYMKKDIFIIVSALIGHLLLLYMIGDSNKYRMFLHSMNATCLVSIGIVAIKTMGFKIDKFYIFLSLIFFITGIIEGSYIIFKLMNNQDLLQVKNIKFIVAIITDAFPLIGIYYSFNYIKKDRSMIKDLIFILSVLTLLLIVVLTSNVTKNIYIYKMENRFYVEFLLNIFLLGLAYLITNKIRVCDDYLDNNEKSLLKKIIILISLSRIPNLMSASISELYARDILSKIIENISLYYLYKYIIYTNFNKPYNTLNMSNRELNEKSFTLKQNNLKLIEETNKIKELKAKFINEELKLSSTLDSSINSILVFDEKFDIKYSNKVFENLFNGSIKDNIRNYKDFTKNIQDVLESRKSKEYLLKSIDNRIYKAIISPLIIKDKIDGTLCILIDKTKKIKYEKKIVDASSKYKNFLESMGEGVVVLKDKEIIYVNKACKDIFKDELINIDFNQYYKSHNKDIPITIGDEKIYIEMDHSKYTIDGKENTIITIRDITQRKEDQSELKKSRKAHAELIDVLPDGICLLNKDLRITYANKSLLQMIGIDDFEMINNIDIKNIINIEKDEVELFYRKVKKVISENKHMLLLEYELLTNNKEALGVEINALPFTNKYEYVMLIVKDLTYEKASEMAEKEILERLKTDKIKTEFFANMSHELKTPLNVISSSNQLLEAFNKKEKIDDYNNNLKSHISLVRQSSYRLQRLISNIIDLTKIESGFYYLKLTTHNIVSVIEDLFMKIEEYASKKNINIIFDTDSEEIFMNIDKSEIERIILNLLSNCIKFTNPGGTIELNIYNKEREVFISVKDNGVGIPKDKIDLVFEEFGQVDKTLSRNTEGSGIGLSIVKNLVELHGGSIDIKSIEDEGTEFIIRIPIINISQDDYIEDKRIYNIDEKIKIEFSDIYY